MASPLPVQEQLLQNIEAFVVAVYRTSPELLDYEVEAALDALIADYGAEHQGRPPRVRTLDGLRLAVYDSVQRVCEWRLGRSATDAAAMPEVGRSTVGEIVAALTRVRKSQQRWTKQRGRQGYLGFVSRYV